MVIELDNAYELFFTVPGTYLSAKQKVALTSIHSTTMYGAVLYSRHNISCWG